MIRVRFEFAVNDLLRQCWFLAGPTACGKSDVAVQLAERIGAEILSLDSMALYRGMDLGTAKPSHAARARVPHHLIDVIDPHEEFTLADYLDRAREACAEIQVRGKICLFAGGTGLYLRGLLRGLFDGPTANADLRSELEAQAKEHGAEYLHARLTAVDPATAVKLHPNDVRRVIRALEVCELTGRPVSAQRRQGALPPEARPQHVYWLFPPRDWLYDRINRRALAMFAQGLVEEVRGLLALPLGMSKTARQALGYKEVIAHLSGEIDMDAAVELVQRRTRQFAKRQFTWFRNLEECRAVKITGNESPEQIAELILRETA